MNKSTLTKTSVGIIGAILSAVILVEGGFTNDPYDPGGKTKYGITEKTAKDFGYTKRIEDLTQKEAIQIYESLYVKYPHFDYIVELNPALGHKVIDAGINVGTTRVSIWFQKSLNALSQYGKQYPLIEEDGRIGNKTLSAYQSLVKLRGKTKACQLMIKCLDGYQTYYYLSLSQHSRYLTGWLDKRIGNIPLSQCENYDLTLSLFEKINENSKN